jgi:VIT1/CCC1 family predicted Fe2+/Mn2+ transporter
MVRGQSGSAGESHREASQMSPPNKAGAPPHSERHFHATETVRDVVIGMSDGLTVPFALAAGLTGAVSASKIIIAAGMAEIAAGSIAMGLGGYLAARGDYEHYERERTREEHEVLTVPDVEAQEIDTILQSYGLKPEESAPVVKALQQDPKHWIDFMMRFELALEQPLPKRAFVSSLTIAGSYVVGGAVPLSPYFFIHRAQTALLWSVAFTVAGLAIFGYVKGKVVGAKAGRSAMQTVFIGGLAAAAAFLLAKAFS